jgi:hypothetical protein
MKVLDVGFIIFFIFIILLSFSRKGEVFRLVSAKRLFIIGAVASSTVGVILIIVSAAKGASAGEMLGLFGISIGDGLGVAFFVYFFVYFCFHFLPQFYRSFKFKYLRSTFIYGMGFAFLFSMGAFFMTQQNLFLLVASYVSGILLGLVSGRIFIGHTKDRVVDGKYIIEWPQEWDLRKYWKSYVFLSFIVAAMFLLPNIMFESTDMDFSAFTGLFFGIMLYHLIWVIMYEQRNHVRLENEIRP